MSDLAVIVVSIVLFAGLLLAAREVRHELDARRGGGSLPLQRVSSDLGTIDNFEILRAISPKRLRFPSPYPGESPGEYKTRLGVDHPQAPMTPLAESVVWSDLLVAWVEPPAQRLPEGSRVEPRDRETIDAYQRRRESLGIYMPRATLPLEFEWRPEAQTFLAPGSALPPPRARLDSEAASESVQASVQASQASET